MFNIKEVAPWPIQLALDDIRAAVSLYYYARYGLDMREALEISGPYEFRTRDIRYLNGIGILGSLSEAGSRDFFAKHRVAVTEAACYQLVLSCYSAFEFLIANLILFLYICAKTEKQPPTGFQFMWNQDLKDRFLNDPRIADIESPKWMERHHRFEEFKKRVGLLDDVCHLQIRGFSIQRKERTLDWSFFLDSRKLRHAVAHTSGRASLYSSADLGRKPILPSDLLKLEDYLTGLINNINHRLYAIPVVRYVHAD